MNDRVEFDGDDNELANLDLEAVVASHQSPVSTKPASRMKQSQPVRSPYKTSSQLRPFSPHGHPKQSPINPYKGTLGTFKSDASPNYLSPSRDTITISHMTNTLLSPTHSRRNDNVLDKDNFSKPIIASVSRREETLGEKAEDDRLRQEIQLLKHKNDELENELRLHSMKQQTRKSLQIDFDQTTHQNQFVNEPKSHLEKELIDCRNEKEKFEKEAILVKQALEAHKQEFEKFKELHVFVENDGIKQNISLDAKLPPTSPVKKRKHSIIGTNSSIINPIDVVDLTSEKMNDKEIHSLDVEKESLKTELTRALEEKERMNRETILLKQQLDKLTHELNKKKTRNSNQAVNTTIVKSMKVVDLKLEALVRGIDSKRIVSMNKGALLDFLVVGSFRITGTDTWAEILRLREKVTESCDDVIHKAQEQVMIKQRKLEEKQLSEKERKDKARAAEVASQIEKHKHHFPKVHECKLAKTDELFFHDKPRCEMSQCSTPNCTNTFSSTGCYSCEKCDFDICHVCFRYLTMSPKEKAAYDVQQEKQRKKEEKDRFDREKKWEEEDRKRETEFQRKWNHQHQFKQCIINPPSKNLTLDGSKMKGYTVWCSDGYEYDGWHSYGGPPIKDFDSTFATKEDANARARYLFYWKNCWGIEPESIDDSEVQETSKNGLYTYSVCPEDSSRWTVGVVPDSAYAHLENVSNRHHNHDYV